MLSKRNTQPLSSSQYFTLILPFFLWMVSIFFRFFLFFVFTFYIEGKMSLWSTILFYLLHPLKNRVSSHENLNFKLSSTIWYLLHVKIISELLWTSSNNVTLELAFPQEYPRNTQVCEISKTDRCSTTLPYSTCSEFYLLCFPFPQ